MNVSATNSITQYSKQYSASQNKSDTSFGMTFRKPSPNTCRSLARIASKDPSTGAKIASAIEEAAQNAFNNVHYNIDFFCSKVRGKETFFIQISGPDGKPIPSRVSEVLSLDVPPNDEIGIDNFGKNLSAQIEQAQILENEYKASRPPEPVSDRLRRILSALKP